MFTDWHRPSFSASRKEVYFSKPTPVFLPGKFHGQRSLQGYSPWSCKESDMTEHVSFSIEDTKTNIFTRQGEKISKLIPLTCVFTSIQVKNYLFHSVQNGGIYIEIWFFFAAAAALTYQLHMHHINSS